MCVRVYILSDTPLPERMGVRGCNVSPIGRVPVSKAVFPMHTCVAEFTIGGCGCALVPVAAHRENGGSGPNSSPHHLLGEVLKRCLSEGHRVELLVSWAGRETDAATQRPEVTVDVVAEGRLPLSECVDGPPLRVGVVAGGRTVKS